MIVRKRYKSSEKRNIFLRLYLIVMWIGDAGVNSRVGNEGSFSDDHVWPSSNRQQQFTSRVPMRRERIHSIHVVSNDNALVAFWHLARAERKALNSFYVCVTLSLFLGHLSFNSRRRSRKNRESARERPRRKRALNPNETIRSPEKARQSTNARRHATPSRDSARCRMWRVWIGS